MSRPKYVVARLVLLVLVATMLVLAIHPMLRIGVVRCAALVTGAKIRVNAIRSVPWQGRVELLGMDAVDPQRTSTRLFSAERVSLELDPKALLHRRVIVNRARVSGIQIGTRPASSGVWTPTESGVYTENLAAQFANTTGRWLSYAVKRMREETGSELAAARLADELADRWPGELDRVESKTESLTTRVSQLRAVLEDGGTNPLRNAGHYQTALDELEQLRGELADVRREMENVQQQFMMDCEAVATAREQDRAAVARKLNLPTLNGDDLSEYFLGQEVSQRVAMLVQWIRWGRGFLPSLTAQAGRVTPRGQEVWFAGLKPVPQVLIRSAVLSGAGDVDGNPVVFEGRISELASQPALLDRATELVIQTSAEVPILIQAVFGGPHKRDQITVHCPRLALPQRTLGDPDQLALQVAPCECHLRMEVELNEDGLAGTMVLIQPRTPLSVELGKKLSSSDAEELVAKALEDVDQIEARLELAGTIHHPRWKLQSNLGRQIALNLRMSLERELTVRFERDAGQIEQQLDTQARKMAEEMAARRDGILRDLELGDIELGRVRQFIATRVELSNGPSSHTSPLR
jgi:uncharacterized protein (TIGR03545 family)